jgi:hypothetical protein
MIIQKKTCYSSGASESIGFLLMFTIIMAGIGLVTLYGLPMLLQQQTSADEKIMEKNMIVLQNDFKSIVYKTIPFKETSMKVASGALSVNNNETSGPAFTISAGGTDYLTAYKSGDLRYRSSQSDAEISLQNGAVVKRDYIGTGSTMLAQPRWYLDKRTGTLVINMMTIKSSEGMSREGIGTVQMELGETTYQYVTLTAAAATSTVRVTINFDSGHDYSKAWDNYFQMTFGVMPSVTGPQSRAYDITSVNTLVVKTTDIYIRSV